MAPCRFSFISMTFTWEGHFTGKPWRAFPECGGDLGVVGRLRCREFIFVNGLHLFHGLRVLGHITGVVGKHTGGIIRFGIFLHKGYVLIKEILIAVHGFLKFRAGGRTARSTCCGRSRPGGHRRRTHRILRGLPFFISSQTIRQPVCNNWSAHFNLPVYYSMSSLFAARITVNSGELHAKERPPPPFVVRNALLFHRKKQL